MFDIPQVGAVAKAAQALMADQERNSANLTVITINPHSGSPCMLVMGLYYGPASQADEYYAPIKALNPMIAMGSMINYSEVNNGIDPFCVKGGFKRFLSLAYRDLIRTMAGYC